MKFYSAAMRRLALAVTCVFGFMTVAIPVAQAGMISVEQHALSSAVSEQRSQVQRFLQREDVRAQLVQLGVDPELAQTRANSLSDAELARAANLTDQPAGAGAAGAIVLIFLVLLLTDILGITDVFSFVKK